MYRGLVESLAENAGRPILLCVLDGLGDLPIAELGGKTPLEAARTPNLDRLAIKAALGQHIPIEQGITPGSGPAHLALFGYDPVEYFVGRGILSALGIGFPVKAGDLAARANFCTLGADGTITDRRAGRIDTSRNSELTAKLSSGIRIPGFEVFVETEKEHRACVVIRGAGLTEEVSDTDPGHDGLPPLAPKALQPSGETAARVISEFLDQAGAILAGERPANGILLRGFACHRRFPTLLERFGLRSAAAAVYPMYRGVAALIGMDVRPCKDMEEEIRAASKAVSEGCSFVFLHYKPTDSSGEDGNWQAKTAAIESFDSALPAILECGFGVLCITGDHSTPCAMKLHSWHPVPVLLHGGPQRSGWSARFTEKEAAAGALGTFSAVHLMTLMLSSAGRLGKYGA
jgi:2,3-bisphosphoglycerate-independent phosphoglycerate mutase